MRLLCLVLAVCLSALAQPASIQPDHLRCEYRENPLGIDVATPRLSWALKSVQPQARGLRQTAYRVIAASTEELLRAGKGDLWDTGRVASDQSIHVAYSGKPLDSGRAVHWRVQVWDEAGRPSGWSPIARWSMGLLRPQDWKAKWIGIEEAEPYRHRSSPFWSLRQARWIWLGAPDGKRYFRTKVPIPANRKLSRAVAILGAAGEYELEVNGLRAGKGTSVLIPDVLDITTLVKAGENSLAVAATHTAKGKPAGLIGAVRVEFASGEPLLVHTGPQWGASETAGGPFSAARDVGAYGIAPWGEVGFSEERVLPARLLRKEFALKPGWKRATVSISGLGSSELYLNGAKVSDHVLSPGLTDYDKRVLYVTHDVTNLLKAGPNAIGAMLGNGRYHAPREKVPIGMRNFGTPRLLLQLDIEYADGSTTAVVSDESWAATTRGPIRANNEFDGEEYDARMETPGWDRPGFPAEGWEAAKLAVAPKGRLTAQMAEPLRVTETVRPVSIAQLSPDRYVFDMGQNIVGWIRLKVTGPKGARVLLRHAETLDANGRLYTDNLRSARATNSYTLKGGGPETWEPRFTYHGFRYVELSGFPGTPTLDSLDGRVVHDALPAAGTWTSSNPLLNRIHKNISWGMRGNYRSIPTDCPQRDERQGWLGDRSVVSRSESYLFDIAAFYSKWIADIADAQRPNGSVPDVAPNYWILYNNNVTWPGTFVLIPAMLYDQYGDRRVIERDYPAIRKWIEFMRTFLKEDLMPKDTYGDWCVPPESPELIHSRDPARKTDGTLIGTAYFYNLLKLVARYAVLLDRKADAAEYEALAARLRTAFEKRFYNEERRQYDNGTQTSSILPLAFGIAPEHRRKDVFASLVRRIEGESRNHIGVGLVGAQWLMRTLSDNGRADLAYTIATQTSYPGWGYMIEKGATTIWELWNGDTADPAMNSGNHVMQIGDLAVWMYEYLAGIRPDPARPGFKHMVVKPHPVGDLSFVRATHRSLFGAAVVEWKRSGREFTLRVSAPPNTTATVYVPAAGEGSVTESGKAAEQSVGVKFLRMEDGNAVYMVQSGDYVFATVR